jgi:hypothetical protein
LKDFQKTVMHYFKCIFPVPDITETNGDHGVVELLVK